VYDFSDASVDHYEQRIGSALKGIDVGVLVNNVGYSYEYPELLHKVDGGLRRLADITVINTLPTTLVSSETMFRRTPPCSSLPLFFHK
jgi:hypothetical protein